MAADSSLGNGAHEAADPFPSEAAAPSRPPRRLSLDTLRGASVLAMLLVNNVALDTATPVQFQHADWAQMPRLADFVFPVFLLAVGVSIPFALAGHRRRGGRLGSWIIRALGRAAGLFLIGCFLDSSLARTPLWGMGVLQLIALAGLVGALLAPAPALVRAAAAIALGTGYGVLLAGEPLAEGVSAAQRITSEMLAPRGLAGVLSVVPTAALVLGGAVAGDLLRATGKRPWQLPAWLVGGGAALAGAGYLLADLLPMHKAIWTPSYLLWTGGWGAAALGALALLLDTPPLSRVAFWSWPLRVAGANALIAYAMPIVVKALILRVWTWHGVVLETALRDACFARWGRLAGGWVWTVGYVVAWWLVLAALYARKIFVRL